MCGCKGPGGRRQVMEGGSLIPADDQRARQTEARDRTQQNSEETHRELLSLVSTWQLLK